MRRIQVRQRRRSISRMRNQIRWKYNRGLLQRVSKCMIPILVARRNVLFLIPFCQDPNRVTVFRASHDLITGEFKLAYQHHGILRSPAKYRVGRDQTRPTCTIKCVERDVRTAKIKSDILLLDISNLDAYSCGPSSQHQFSIPLRDPFFASGSR